MYDIEWLFLAPLFVDTGVARCAARDLLHADQP
jgi:hypothetical protein